MRKKKGSAKKEKIKENLEIPTMMVSATIMPWENGVNPEYILRQELGMEDSFDTVPHLGSTKNPIVPWIRIPAVQRHRKNG